MKTCAWCGNPWEDSRLCPGCEDERDAIQREIEACPCCGGVSDWPGELCPGCEEIAADCAEDAP